MKERYSVQQEGTELVADRLYEVTGVFTRDGKIVEYCNLFEAPGPTKAKQAAEKDYKEHIRVHPEPGVKYGNGLHVKKVVETTWDEVRKSM